MKFQNEHFTTQIDEYLYSRIERKNKIRSNKSTISQKKMSTIIGKESHAGSFGLKHRRKNN